MQLLKIPANLSDMKTPGFLLILFHLTVAATFATAQTPRGMLAGTITSGGNPVVGAALSVKLRDSTDYNRIQTVHTNEDGNFTAHVEAGVYVVIAESKCVSSRTENVEVRANKTAVLNVTLVKEDCAEKEAQKDLEWKICQQEMRADGLQINDSDKAELINQVLEELFRFETAFVRDNYQEIIFSTENLDPARIKAFPLVNFSFLTPQQLQAKADFSQERGIGYYAFNLQPGSTCAYVGISMQTAVSKNKPPPKDPNVFECPVGTSKGYMFRKESGKWKMKFSRG